MNNNTSHDTEGLGCVNSTKQGCVQKRNTQPGTQASYRLINNQHNYISTLNLLERLSIMATAAL